MKIAAVVIDAWKLAIFKRHLENAKFAFTEQAGFTKDSLLLQVKYEWVATLKPIIEAANIECAKSKLQ